MKCVRIESPDHWKNSVRGPELARWITDEDLRFPAIDGSYSSAKGSVNGALTHDYWVLFFQVQVVQIIPDEVHSEWHYDFMDGFERGCAWEILDSEWLKSFHPRHLHGFSHFLIQFYDEVIEVICKDVVFGRTPFSLTNVIKEYPKFCMPYLKLAKHYMQAGEVNLAIKNFEKCLSLEPDLENTEFARRSLAILKKR